jgi:Flp pilus assembly protein TadG
VIVLVAVVMLFVVGAMAALSIDVVTLYTARSEAQLAADGAALAGARVLANSGATSDATGTLLTAATSATGPAQKVAVQVAIQNQVGGTNLTTSNVTVTFGNLTAPYTNPTVKVSVQASLPTFFARIWGSKQVTVAASATAEAYNPSPTASAKSGGTPVAPICVKPWLLPNIDPTSPPLSPTAIFDRTTGAISDQNLLGWTSNNSTPQLIVACTNGDCSGTLPPPKAWKYYPGDPATTFPPPAVFPTCNPAMATPYEESVAGCVQTAIACNDNSANIDTSQYLNRNLETAEAANCLTHAANRGGGDTVTTTPPPAAPIEFVAGDDNPFVLTGATSAGTDIMVSDSLVTVPVYDVGPGPPPYGPPPATNVQIIGFVQLFLNPNGRATRTFGPNKYLVNTTIINMSGCGTSATGQPILGNGASPVAVRLITPP